MLSPLPAISTKPSLQRYAFDGAMPGKALPAASRTAPKALYSGTRLSMTLNTASLQRHVDHLPLAAIHLAVVERGEHADGAVQRGQRVADGDAAAHRHAAPARR
jgi:hypothetical protein